jgi:hypothetical protein
MTKDEMLEEVRLRSEKAEQGLARAQAEIDRLRSTLYTQDTWRQKLCALLDGTGMPLPWDAVIRKVDWYVKKLESLQEENARLRGEALTVREDVWKDAEQKLERECAKAELRWLNLEPDKQQKAK